MVLSSFNREIYERDLREEGREEERQKLNSLYSQLIEAGRTEDIAKAAKDSEYLKKLYSEFGLEGQ